MIIDISKYQNKIDWAKLKPNIEGVYIKATDGVGYVDPAFKKSVINASAQNVPIGFYHFASLNSPDVIADSAAEAKAFSSAIKGIKATLPPVLDIEKNASKLSPDEVLKWINNFVLQMSLADHPDIVIYSYTPFLNANLPLTHNVGRLKLWLAAYVSAPPQLPRGWKAYWLWQYSSDGKVLGIEGRVDLNKKGA